MWLFVLSMYPCVGMWTVLVEPRSELDYGSVTVEVVEEWHPWLLQKASDSDTLLRLLT